MKAAQQFTGVVMAGRNGVQDFFRVIILCVPKSLCKVLEQHLITCKGEATKQGRTTDLCLKQMQLLCCRADAGLHLLNVSLQQPLRLTSTAMPRSIQFANTTRKLGTSSNVAGPMTAQLQRWLQVYLAQLLCMFGVPQQAFQYAGP